MSDDGASGLDGGPGDGPIEEPRDGTTIGPASIDRKAPGAMRTIGEVALTLGIRQHVLRYWEEQFPALRPLKRAGGRRYYRPEDVTLIATIDRLVNHEGYTLRGARLAIDAGLRTPPIAVPSTMAADFATTPDQIAGLVPEDLRPRLRALRDTLAAALAG